jgi:hypothetical protein
MKALTVLLDGVRIPDFRALDDIDAQSILVIYIYNGIEGTTYGSRFRQAVKLGLFCSVIGTGMFTSVP